MSGDADGRFNPAAIKTPLAFFALVVLITEVALTITAANIDPGDDRRTIIVASIAIMILLIIIVATLAYWSPWVLSGQPPPAIQVTLVELNPPPLTDTPEVIRWFLRGIRFSYYRLLQESNLEPPKQIRVNVMLVFTIRKGDRIREHLKLQHVDYNSDFDDAEFTVHYQSGEGKCGWAWQNGQQAYYATDRNEPAAKRVEMPDAPAPTEVTKLKSILSTPIFCNSRCVAVLNLDSYEDSRTTHVQNGSVQDLLRSGSRAILPLLFPLPTESS